MPSPTNWYSDVHCIAHFCNRKHGCLYADTSALVHHFLSFLVHQDCLEDRCRAHPQSVQFHRSGVRPTNLHFHVTSWCWWSWSRSNILRNTQANTWELCDRGILIYRGCLYLFILCEVDRVSRATDQIPNPSPLTCPVPPHQVLVYWTEGNGSRNDRGAHLLPPFSPSTNVNTTQVVLLLQEIHSYCN